MPLKSTHRRMSTQSLWSVCPVHKRLVISLMLDSFQRLGCLTRIHNPNAFYAFYGRQFVHELQSENGGSTNAYTSSESTNYHFDVNQEHLEGALDRFAQFFISPTISQDGVEREVNAVDSE